MCNCLGLPTGHKESAEPQRQSESAAVPDMEVMSLPETEQRPLVIGMDDDTAEGASPAGVRQVRSAPQAM